MTKINNLKHILNMNWAAKITLWFYRLVGIDIKPIIMDERRFNIFSTIYLVFFVFGIIAGILGIILKKVWGVTSKPELISLGI